MVVYFVRWNVFTSSLLWGREPHIVPMLVLMVRTLLKSVQLQMCQGWLGGKLLF